MEPTMEVRVEPAGEARPLLGPEVKIDEGCIREHLDEVVRSTVEETLNALLDAEADDPCEPGSTSAARAARTHVQATVTDICRPRPERGR